MTYGPFFDTLQEERKDSIDRAISNNERVLAFFRENPMKLFTPLEVHRQITWPGRTPPESSTKRAITTLTKRGFLVKTRIKRMEKYGENNFCWTFKGIGIQGSIF